MWNSMTPDERIWVEQAIAVYLRSRTFMAEIPPLLVGRVLAQLLYYWQCEVPEKWDFATGNADYASLALSRAEDMTSVYETSLDCASYGADVYEALDSCDWEKMLALPDKVWKWISNYTGLSKDQWQQIADKAQNILNSKLSCPNCSSVFKLLDIGAPDKISDPFSMGSSRSSLRFTCPRCSHQIVLNASEQSMGNLGEDSKIFTNISWVIIAVIFIAIVLIMINRSI